MADQRISGQKSFWASLSPAERGLIQAAGRPVSYRGSAVIMAYGAPAGGVLVIGAGRVHVVRDHEDGTSTILAERGAGDIVGEIGAIQGAPRNAGIVATGPVTGIALDRPQFRDLLRRNPGITEHLFAVVADRLNEADRHRAAASRPVPARLALVLLELAEPDDGDVAVVHIGQEDLRRYVGASRAQIARGLQALRADGIIETAPRRITIASRRRLHDQINRGQ